MLITSSTDVRVQSQSLFERWYSRETLLARATLIVLALIPLLLVASSIDERTLNGLNIWIKPLKFNLSIVVYLGTLTWFAGWINRSVLTHTFFRVYVVALCGALLFMLLWLYGAAVIGEPAHFNRHHPILAPMYSVMGVVSVFFTTGAIVFAALIAFNRQSQLTSCFRHTVVWSLVISFVFTVFMAGELASMDSHWIGGTESDRDGLWLLGWSRDGGDLRVAHFFSLHAMQLLPLAGLVALPGYFAKWPRLTAAMLSIFYCGFLFHVYFQAKNGNPFLPWLG